jgi:L-rhamnose mutarotase
MIRKASIMQVAPDAHAEYQRRHEQLWPEMATELKAHGAHRYSIFLDPERNLLFAYVEIDSEAQWAAMADTAICRKWWAYMKDIMPSNPDDSPVSEPLHQVFYLE